MTDSPDAEAPLTDAELDEIERGLEGVTPGPWRAGDERHAGQYQLVESDQLVRGYICEVQAHGEEIAPLVNAAHIARLDPGTVRRLVAMARRTPPVEDRASAALSGGEAAHLKSTAAMRDRFRELATPDRDDFDRAGVAILDDLEAILAVSPSGWRLVPVDPTVDMVTDGRIVDWQVGACETVADYGKLFRRQWAAALAASPTPPASAGDPLAETCIACGEPLVDGDMVLDDVSGGLIHVACCGPSRESYVNADGEPLGPDDPIPTGFAWHPWPDPVGSSTHANLADWPPGDNPEQERR